jgi:hypothetical protein
VETLGSFDRFLHTLSSAALEPRMRYSGQEIARILFLWRRQDLFGLTLLDNKSKSPRLRAHSAGTDAMVFSDIGIAADAITG